MSIFKCSECDYSSNLKFNVKKHCENVNLHETKTEIIKIDSKIGCEFCKKEYSTKPSLTRHLKSCKAKESHLIEENRVLREKLAISEALNKKPTTINNITNNITNNIKLTSYNNPNLEGSEKYFKQALRRLCMAVPNLIENIHFNEKTPENHNLCIKNARTKLARVFNGKRWITMNEDEVLDELVSTYESLLDEYATDKSPDYIQSMDEIKDRITEEVFCDNVKIEVKKILYNNKEMIKVQKVL